MQKQKNSETDKEWNANLGSFTVFFNVHDFGGVSLKFWFEIQGK